MKGPSPLVGFELDELVVLHVLWAEFDRDEARLGDGPLLVPPGDLDLQGGPAQDPAVLLDVGPFGLCAQEHAAFEGGRYYRLGCRRPG